MDASRIEALRQQITDVAATISGLGMSSTGPELLVQEAAHVSAATEPTDEQEMQKWRAVDREIWNAYNALQQAGRALAELSWLGQRVESGDADPAVQLQAALAQINDLKAQLAAADKSADTLVTSPAS